MSFKQSPTSDAPDRARLTTLLGERFPGAQSRIERIPAGLGDRRFYRIELDAREATAPATLIARVEPEPKPTPVARTPFSWLPEPRLEPIRGLLEAAGLPVPRSFAHDPDAGIDLLEDVGDETLADLAREEQFAGYLEACAWLPRIQAIEGEASSAPAFGRFLDADLIRTKAAKLVHWCWPGLLGREATSSEREIIESSFDAIAALLARAPQRLAHRDFKAENLHFVRAADGARRLVMIDVQGAFMAPPEYDLVCLLRDLQVDLPEAWVEDARDRTLASLPTLPTAADRADARLRFEAISVVRLAKDLAHVVDAGRSRGDLRRWNEIPRGLELLSGASDRLGDTFPPARALNFVIHVLTEGARTSDSGPSRQGK